MTGIQIGYLWIAIVFFVLLLDFLKYLKKSNSKTIVPPKKLAIFKKRGVESGEGSNAQKPNEAPPPPVKKKPAVVKPLAIHEGILLSAGFAKQRGIDSYCLEIQGDELGVSYEIWGIDLKRALEVSGVEIGDRISATLVGHIETSSIDGGASSTKKIWNVAKID